MLNAGAEMLEVWCAQISLKRKARARYRHREKRGKRIAQRQRQTRQREKQLEIKKRLIEIKPFTRRQRRLIEVHTVARSYNGLPAGADRPRETNTWRKVVFVTFVAAAWYARGSNAHQRARDRIIKIRAILGIDRRRVVFVTHARRQRHVRPYAHAVVHIKVVTLGSQMLMIVEPR